MNTKLREGEEREMLLKLTRSTLGALNFSLRVSTKLRRERREGAFLLQFWISRFSRMGNEGVRKKEGRSQPYPLTCLSLPTVAAEAPIPALEYPGNGLEFLAQTLLSRMLAWVGLPH